MYYIDTIAGESRTKFKIFSSKNIQSMYNNRYGITVVRIANLNDNSNFKRKMFSHNTRNYFIESLYRISNDFRFDLWNLSRSKTGYLRRR